MEIDMEKIYRLAILVFLALCGMALTAYSQEQAALTIYVHESDLNGTMLSGVQITGTDAAGNEFAGITDSDGAVVVYGNPGTWQFAFSKEGYESVDLSYDVAETEEAAAYLKKETTSQDEVALTVYVHEGNLNGTLLSSVQIVGEDAAGNEFAGVTDSNGAVVIYGQPGTWQFAFSKEGYESVDLSYDVAETEEAAAYLEKTA
jgi:phosphatidate phosphatase APP1